MLRLLLLLITAALAFQVQAQYSQEDIDSGKTLDELSRQAVSIAQDRLAKTYSQACTKENIRVRREWRNMPGEERISFANAVLCLQRKPSLYPDIDGTKSLFEDFAVLHYNLTHFHHFSATFFLFHRYYLWTFEDALRDECGYKGTLPYWEWGLDVDNLETSPLFDGSPTSLGSNGVYDPHDPLVIGNTVLPSGTGGGCVHSGPFSNMTVHLGPMSGMLPPSPNPLASNPRCIRRDLNTQAGARWASLRNSTELILQSRDIAEFQTICQADPRYPIGAAQGLGVHGGGHYMIGGDPGSDMYLSPGEPGFYLHHGQIDRLYWIWQQLDWETRQNIAGTRTMLNIPPSDEVDIDELLDISPLNTPQVLRSLMDTVSGSPLCFVYSAE